MIAKSTAIIVAATCAALIVCFVPGFASGVAASTTQDHRTACTESWPYYEASCLRDDSQSDGKARVVRMIPLDRAASFEQRWAAR